MIVDKGKYYLYKHIRLDNNQPFYIGIGTKSGDFASFNTEYRRAFSTKKRNIHWKRVVNKTKYLIEIILESDNANFIKEKEIEFISFYGRSNDGGILTNITKGGDGTHGFSRTAEINKIIADKCRGRNNVKSLYCYQYDNDYKLIRRHDSFNMAAQSTGLKKQNILEAKNKLGRCGGYYWFTELFNESKIKELVINKPKRVSKGVFIEQYSKEGVLIGFFDKITSAQKLFSPNNSKAISRCLQGLTKTAYGFVWKYKIIQDK